MVPLHSEAIARVIKWDLGEHRALSLRHALIHRRPGLLGDHPRVPRSVLLMRDFEAPEGWHVFGAGSAEPAVAWLAQRGKPLSLLAPESWEGAIRKRSPMIQRGSVETWIREADEPEVRTSTKSQSAVITRPIVLSDYRAFVASAPDWALRGWGDFVSLLDRGAAVGVPDRAGRFASLAWVYEADASNDSVAVATDPRYQRLGLGHAAAAALIAHVETARKKLPVWTVNESNLPSKALARSLGFSPRSRESVLRWNL